MTAPLGTFITATTYRGAFGGSNWAAGWTKLWTEGWFSLASAGDGTDTSIISGSANKFVNISTLDVTSATGNVLTAGFVIPAGQAHTVLVRGIGLGLTPLGVSGVVPGPIIESIARARGRRSPRMIIGAVRRLRRCRPVWGRLRCRPVVRTQRW